MIGKPGGTEDKSRTFPSNAIKSLETLLLFCLGNWVNILVEVNASLCPFFYPLYRAVPKGRYRGQLTTSSSIGLKKVHILCEATISKS